MNTTNTRRNQSQAEKVTPSGETPQGESQAENVTPQAEIVTLPIKPTKIILGGGHSMAVTVIQKQLDGLMSQAGQVIKAKLDNQARLNKTWQEEQAKRLADGKSVSVVRAKSEYGKLTLSGMPCNTELALMVKLEIIKPSQADKVKRLDAFQKALADLVNA